MSLKSTLRDGVFSLLTKARGDAEGLVLLPTLTGPAKGLRFKLDLVDRIESAYLLGTYDLTITQRLQSIVRQGWVVWDCGVYLGYYTSLFARLVGPGGKVIGIEPDMRNLTRARDNALGNGFRNVEFVNAAIGGVDAEIDFILSDNTNSHIPGVYVGSSAESYSRIEKKDAYIRVRCMTLDGAYREGKIPAPDLIKIDIEGAEKEAIQHVQVLAREKKPLIVLELHNPECDAAAWDFSQATGYSLESLDTGARITRREDVGGTLLCSPPR